MYYTIIKFPFSSVNDHGYTLWVCLNASGDMSNLTDAIAADSEVFRRKPTQTVMGDTIYNFEGTLSGSVKVTDDEREDFWTPLVCSKLSFNMACETFPVWLMEYCNNNRAKVILTKDDAKPHVMWHGYLIAQTLNMTVVRNLMACPMVAVDEVAMAKYMNFKETMEYVTSDHWCSVFGLMEHYHTLHHTRGLSAASPGFEKLYYILNLTHSNRLLWHRNLAIQDSNGTDINDLPGTLMVNLDRWLQDKEATWEECLTELCEYLGVTFAVGSYGLMTNCDAYLLTCPTDSPTVQQFVYTFDNHSVVSHSTSMYATLDNPTKLGGNLQITSEPDRYKAVEVTSVPERWKGHEYLTEEHYKEIAPDKQVRFEWGTTQDATNGPFDTYGWHKLVYIKPTTDEENYVTLPDCQDGEGYVMARDGILPYDDLSSCVGLGQPTGGVADSLDFITFKEGATCVKIGGGEIGGVDEDKHLVPFFLILNHMWSNMWNRTPYTMQSSHIADTPFLTLTPFADNGPTHPSESHYLTLSMRVKFIRENMSIGANSDGSPLHWLWFASPGVGHTMRVLDWQSPAILMPCEDSEYPNFEDPTSIYTGNVAAWNQIYFTARLRVGDHYWNGNSWVTTPATCDIRLLNTTSEVTEVDKYGIRTIETKNYYYTFGSPYYGNTSVDKMTDPKMLVDCRGVSIPNAPLQGQLKLEILGQIRFQNTIPGAQGVANSVPFILIDNVDIGWTDDAELMGKDIELKQKSVMDASSHTKQTLERSVKMSSPQVDGFFDNALVFDNGKAWQNLRQVKVQGALPLLFTPEWSILQRLSWQYGSGQLYVELETPVDYDDNVHNIDFTVTNLTEAKGDFMPLRRVFDYTLDRMRVKLMRINMPGARLTGIDASFEPGAAVIYDTDSLDDLKQYLTVVASYDNGLQRTLNSDEYTLTGTLTAPSSTITVAFELQTDTFTVQVTHIYPYDSLVEYLESDGSQYINLGITPSANEVIKIKFKRVSGTSFAVYLGSRGGVGDRQCYIGQYNSKFVASIGTTNSTALANFDTNEHTIIMDTATGLVSIDGGTSVNCGAFVSSPYNLCLFALNTNGTIANNSKIQIMEVVVGTRMTLYPCRKDGVGYMYDAITDSLLPNNGTFAYGNDV